MRQPPIVGTNIKQSAHLLLAKYRLLRRRAFPYKPQGALGPEHEFSIVDEQMKPLPISDKIIGSWLGKIADTVYMPGFSFGKENMLHQMEIRARKPFKSPEIFEETMENAVSCLLEFMRTKHQAYLLGTGMHPTLTSEETKFWPHSNQETIRELKRIFNLKKQGWINIQSYQLNLPYYNETWGVAIHNALAHLCAYLPSISASSPICEGKLGPEVDCRLHYYGKNMSEIPSITGNVIPEYINSFDQFRRDVIEKYMQDLSQVRAGNRIVRGEWLNQRGVVFKFSRDAIEVRIMDEQECIKSDVALSCFIRATIRGLIESGTELPSNQLLVNDYRAIVNNGLQAEVQHPHGRTAREVCQYFFKIASEHADYNEKRYLWIVKKRIDEGNLSEIIRKRVLLRSQKTTFTEAIVSIYLQLVNALSKNQPYF